MRVVEVMQFAGLDPEAQACVRREVALAARAQELAEAGDHRMASQLIELAAQASEDAGVWRLRADLYRRRAHDEVSLMSRGVFNEAARSSDARADDLDAG